MLGGIKLSAEFRQSQFQGRNLRSLDRIDRRLLGTSLPTRRFAFVGQLLNPCVCVYEAFASITHLIKITEVGVVCDSMASMRPIFFLLATAIASAPPAVVTPAAGTPDRTTLTAPVAQGAEATSLLGEKLAAPPLAPDARARLNAQLAEALSTWEKNPDDADALIWVGRRAAYVGHFRDAIAFFTDGIARHPDDARFYRHRGHRYLTIREIDLAVADLERAVALIQGAPDQVEPDGQPNSRNIPTSTLQSNIYYHLALAYYLKGDFGRAADTWRLARDVVRNADNLVAASNWMYLSLRRAGRTAEAAAVLSPIDASLDVIENGSYHSLLLMYKGQRTPEEVLAAAGEGASATAVRYGVSVWSLINGNRREAERLWATILAGPDWPSFGHLAAEAEIGR